MGSMAEQPTETARYRMEPYEIEKTEDANVKVDRDSLDCNIHGSCLLPDGGMLITDHRNNKLKRLDSSYKVVDTLDIDQPNGVCYNRHTQEAAIAGAANQVFIVSMNAGLEIVKTIELDDKKAKSDDKRESSGAFGVACSNKLMYVGTRRKLFMYDNATKKRESVVDNHWKFRLGSLPFQHIFSSVTRHIATSPDGPVWVADCGKGLIKLDKNGKQLLVVQDDELEDVCGVYVDSRSVFVCGFDSRTVLQLSPDGEKICTLVTSDKLPSAPQSVCFDKFRSRLLVTMYNSNSIKVFHLKKD